jgi:hypothetical protein
MHRTLLVYNSSTYIIHSDQFLYVAMYDMSLGTTQKKQVVQRRARGSPPGACSIVVVLLSTQQLAAGGGHVQVLPLLQAVLRRLPEGHPALPLQLRVPSGLLQRPAAAGASDVPRRLQPHLPHTRLRRQEHRLHGGGR